MLDIATLLSTNALLSSAAAAVMAVVLRTRKTYPGFGHWTAGLVCMALGAALLVPDVLPPSWSARMLRNGLLVAGHVLLLRGMLAFRGLRASAWLEAGLAALFLVPFAYLSLDGGLLAARIVYYGLFSGSLCLATVIVTLRRRPPHFGSNDGLLALWLTLLAAISFVRAAQEIANVSTAFEGIRGLGGLYALAQILSVQLVTLTLISMNSQRIEWELRASALRLQASGRFYRCLSLCNEAVARCDNQRALFDAVCQAIIDAAGMRLAWVSLLDEAGQLQVQAQAGAPAAVPRELLQGVDGPDANPTGLALRSGQPVWCQQFQHDPFTRAWKAQVPQAGFGAAAALPVRRGGAVVGALTLCAGDERAFDNETRQLLVDLAANVSFALDNLDREAARRQAQEALDAHRQQLEDTVARRTHQLAEASQRAEAANLAKSAFLANMSHEIRTPLNAMIGMAHLIRREPLSPRQVDRLGKLEAASHHLLEVLNAVLDLSKIEAGKMALDAVPLRVEAAVANVLSMLDERADARHLQLRSDVDRMPADLVGDPTRLQQALLNYANNAVKFTQQGSVTLRARLAELTEDSALLRFEVQDTGVGIAPEVLPRLFAAFEQGDASSTRRAGGTGLGLAITRKLAELMDGEAGASSQPGAGSTFWFTARLRRDPAAASAPHAAHQDAAQAIRQRHAGARVLLAEDNAVNAEMAQALLEEAGLVVDVAGDGLSAVRMAQERAYRLVLMDVQMPGLDGMDACRVIRQRHAPAALPVIAMTANAFAEDKARCQAAGMDDFISKPVDPDSLYRLLLRWLDGSNPPPA
ncbi:ATP-binding protein [Ideonella sp. DXS22W]|uniref:histidine kinase n=1 Tax=Pseudaquabacterium inlustre TaxID=2984192 RepID=A0ABU9CHC0_9BURK